MANHRIVTRWITQSWRRISVSLSRTQSLAQAFLLGHSMGGKVAMQFAGQYPERVDKLVVVDIAPKAYPPTHQSLLAALRAVDLRAAKNFSDIDSALSGPIPDAAVRQFLMKNLTRDDRGFRWRIALDAIMQNYDALTQAVVVERPFSKPACFIRAGRSNFVADEDSRAYPQSFPAGQNRNDRARRPLGPHRRRRRVLPNCDRLPDRAGH